MTGKIIFKGKITKTALALMAASAMAIGIAGTANAGFEWTPPPKAQKPLAMPAPKVDKAPMVDDAPSAPPAMSMSDAPMPATIETGDMMTPPPATIPAAPMPVLREHAASPLPPHKAHVNPVMAIMKPSLAAPMASAPEPMPVERVYEDAMGFGTDIPLAMAMGQIVPPDFSYSFDSGVNPGKRVTWSGGAPWNDVLQQAVAPFGMKSIIVGNTVLIQIDDGGNMSMVTNRAVPRAPAEPVPMMPDYSMAMTTSVAMTPPPAVIPAAPMPAIVPHQPGAPVPLTMDGMPAQPPVSGPASTLPVIFDDSDMGNNELDMGARSYPRRVPPPMDYMGNVPEPGMEGVAEQVVMPTALSPSPYAPRMPQEPVAAVMAPQTAPASVPAEGAVLDPFEIGFWQAEQGSSLRKTLSTWSTKAGVSLVWNSPHDYMLSMPLRMHGTFPDAVTEVLSSFNFSDVRPLGQLHPNLPNGPSVLVIENYSTATN